MTEFGGRVIGSSTALDYAGDDRGGTIMRKPEKNDWATVFAS